MHFFNLPERAGYTLSVGEDADAKAATCTMFECAVLVTPGNGLTATSASRYLPLAQLSEDCKKAWVQSPDKARG